MGEPTLLPCPFCGGEAGVFGYESFMGPRFGCLCGCQINASSAAKWNRRAPNPLAATLAARDERTRDLGTGRQGWPIHPPTVKDSLSVAPDHTEDPRAMVEPAPAPARWRCEGCGENPVKGTPWIIPFSPDPMMVHGENGYYCGPVVPVGEAGS